MDDTDDNISTPPPPAKRGRKPGPLSRSARETQRKLNHSIIEKARRTKINEALTTLRQLVPADYSSPKKSADKDGDETEDGDDIWRDKKLKAKKPPGKKEEKEKEFKLEILVRTVSFMQELVERVKVLEAEGASASNCPTCQTKKPVKRKRDEAVVEEHDLSFKKSRVRDVTAGQPELSTPRRTSIELTARSPPYTGSRLPPISSWLPSSKCTPAQLDPASRSPQQQHTSPIPHLPSPPSSTRFEPVSTPQVPPVLNLGPVAMSSLLSPQRTPEDESAASSLLHFSASSSPLLLPCSSGLSAVPVSTSFDMSKMRTSCVTPVYPDPLRRDVHPYQAQTPRSMLGLKMRW